MSDRDRYASPLGTRYASREMQELFGERRRIGLWRRLWVALAEGERELGVAIPDAALAEMRAAVDTIDFDRAAAYEARFRHDVMAHVHAFGDAAPAARPFIHLGATSAYVTDNADLVIAREGLQLVLARIGAALRALAPVAERYRALPTLAYTHLQPAQLTTVGKRATLWMQDLVLDALEIEHRIAGLALLGCKGTTGFPGSNDDDSLVVSKVILTQPNCQPLAIFLNASTQGLAGVRRVQCLPQHSGHERADGRSGELHRHRGRANYGVFSCLKQRLGQVCRGTLI